LLKQSIKPCGSATIVRIVVFHEHNKIDESIFQSGAKIPFIFLDFLLFWRSLLKVVRLLLLLVYVIFFRPQRTDEENCIIAWTAMDNNRIESYAYKRPSNKILSR